MMALLSFFSTVHAADVVIQMPQTGVDGTTTIQQLNLIELRTKKPSAKGLPEYWSLDSSADHVPYEYASKADCVSDAAVLAKKIKAVGSTVPDWRCNKIVR